ncbi:UvrD-helicase domain-containing protein [Terracidiphilus gabretensis]|uniref:UvrD-helicase domain-containing protein n=1 Tax=Terracidiphilus gabretensis TaxID=1577687 RepID=UPI00071BF9E4|nr:UvrD-helicase domain-containing protein [Terracidiphilus gabretensis]
MNSSEQSLPPDQTQREQALAPNQNILVQAPAGSGKTDLLTRRFLRLLSEVDDPTQIVAITFTKAAAAEMRHRIVTELEKVAASNEDDGLTTNHDAFAMATLAHRALQWLTERGWQLDDLPVQLRITTIDAFCREIAIQQPLLGGLGGTLEIAAEPEELYRRAAQSTLAQLGAPESAANTELLQSIEMLLELQDNNWQEIEDQLVEMLSKRDRWMHDFLLQHEPDWNALRTRLEQPFAAAAGQSLAAAAELFLQLPDICEEALALARFACEQKNDGSLQALAEQVELPCPPFGSAEAIDAARVAWLDLTDLLLTKEGTFRKNVTVHDGFPTDRKIEKQRLVSLLATLCNVEALESTLHRLRTLPPARYTDAEWRIVRACFTLLRHAAAQLRVAFAESGAVDYIEVAQQAQHVLQDDERMPTEAGLRIADEIHHLLVDEFQDTSRRQHQLIAAIAAAWGETTGRSVFAVGDPMQSIYLFRDAAAELFPQVRKRGIDLPGGESLKFNFIRLSSNFRTADALVQELNEFFGSIIAEDNSSSIEFAKAEAARKDSVGPPLRLSFHSTFTPRGEVKSEAAHAAQVAEITELIGNYSEQIEQARLNGGKFRIAVLARTTKMLVPIAAALREAGIPFRAESLESLSERPEVIDALNLARALMNGQNRIAWLGVLRAPWCGLLLADLHTLTSADDPAIRASAIPELLAERMHMLSDSGRQAVQRIEQAMQQAHAMRAAQPEVALGTWLEQTWLLVGGADCVDVAARANLDLLWQCLDALPGAEPDLLGPALGAALKDLTALPDPAAESDYGVHLMTIHKSKGLEFEVIIVPEIHGQSKRTRHRMVAWLERGLSEADEAGEMTEFLVAPQQAKGTERGSAKQWVDSLYAIRERQEIQRLLYVAATRAREELHFFARMEAPADKDKELKPRSNSLLESAWPALKEIAESQFAASHLEIPALQGNETTSSEIVRKPAILHRLPANYKTPAAAFPATRGSFAGLGDQSVYQRHEGGLVSRVLGTAVHTLMAELARQHPHNLSASQAALEDILPRLIAEIRSTGIDSAEAEHIATRALDMVLRASTDTDAQWLLSPHADAASETRWTGLLDGKLRTVQADRIFRAGPKPHVAGNDIWWIVDYKTIESETALPELRNLFEPQLNLYARLLRLLHGPDVEVRAGLYYPRMRLFDWWKI